jgi:hypothetical protein
MFTQVTHSNKLQNQIWYRATISVELLQIVYSYGLRYTKVWLPAMMNRIESKKQAGPS